MAVMQRLRTVEDRRLTAFTVTGTATGAASVIAAGSRSLSPSDSMPALTPATPLPLPQRQLAQRQQAHRQQAQQQQQQQQPQPQPQPQPQQQQQEEEEEEEEEDPQYLQVCPDCGMTLCEDTYIMCYASEAQWANHDDTTFCSCCYWKNEHYKDDRWEDNMDEVTQGVAERGIDPAEAFLLRATS
jgi:hypothetical protein